ncbi:MAG: CBS domain-containing protein [Methanotrichaceae archaeon]|nr:CBS domain-containing protein [Methanotrichaceae archaeon]
MLVEDIMSRDPLYVEDSTFLTKARQLIRDYHVRGLPVVDRENRVLGIVTTQDMLKVTSTKSNVTVSGFVIPVPVLTGDVEMMDAAKLMLQEKSTLLPVVDSREKPVLVGVVSLLDVFRNIDLNKVPKRQIREIMSTRVVTASPDDPITKVWDMMVESDFTGLPVERDRSPMGMITRFDILKRGWARISKESDTRPFDSLQLPVQKLMSTPIYFLTPDESLASAIEVMRKYDIGRISVVEDEKLVGIVDRYDLIKSYLGE